MMRRFALPLLALTLVADVALAGDAIPFKAHLQGQVLSLVMQPPVATVDLVGDGEATHMGTVTVLFPHQVNMLTGHEDGDLTIIAADGSTLTIHIAGPSTPPDANWIVIATPTGVVTGGTGRFEGVAGEVSAYGTVNLATGAVTFELTGTLVKAD